MAILVPLMPMLGALAALGLRKRTARLRWAAAVGLAGVHALVLLVLIPQLPLESQLTTWSPTSLFHGRVALRLDQGAWLLALAAAGLYTAQLLLAAGRERVPSPGQIALGFGYLGLASAAFLAGNLLTVALTWAAVDVLAYVHLLDRSRDVAAVRNCTRGFVLKGASTLVIVAGAIPEAAGGGGPVTQTLEISVLAGALWLRCGMWPLPPAPGAQQSDTVLAGLDRHLPAAMALGALVHVLGGAATSGLAAVLLLIGAANVLLGGLLALTGRPASPAEFRRGWAVAAGGAAMLTMVQPRGTGGLDFAWWGAALVLAGGMGDWLRSRPRWERWIPRLLALMIVLGPGLAAGMADPAGQAQPANSLQIASTVGSVAAGALLGLAVFLWRRSEGWQVSDEPFVGGAAAVASTLPPLGLGAGVALMWPVRWAPTAVYSLLGAGLLAVAYLALRATEMRDRNAAFERAALGFSRVSGYLSELVRRAGDAGLWMLRLLGEVLEGRAALLWVLAVALALALTAVSG